MSHSLYKFNNNEIVDNLHIIVLDTQLHRQPPIRVDRQENIALYARQYFGSKDVVMCEPIILVNDIGQSHLIVPFLGNCDQKCKNIMYRKSMLGHNDVDLNLIPIPNTRSTLDLYVVWPTRNRDFRFNIQEVYIEELSLIRFVRFNKK